MKIYNKLVRDNIPEIMIKNGAKPVTKILSDDEYLNELNKKLQEELFKKEVYTDIGKTKQINDKIDSINKEINELTLEWESLI